MFTEQNETRQVLVNYEFAYFKTQYIQGNPSNPQPANLKYQEIQKFFHTISGLKSTHKVRENYFFGNA